MNNDCEEVYIAFHNNASNLFQSANDNFQMAANKVNRRKEEFLVQRLKEEHVRTFKQQLESCASLLIDKKNIRTEETSQTLNRFINDYLHRFVQKISGY